MQKYVWQAAALGLAEAARLDALTRQEYHSLADVPSEAFPLFLTAKCAVTACILCI